MKTGSLTPRPNTMTRAVRETAAMSVADAVFEWAQQRDVLDAEGDRDQFDWSVVRTVTKCHDSYSAARFMDDDLNWPADRSLVAILDRAYNALPFIAKEAQRRWVMESGTRFPAKKGDKITFKIGTLQMDGKVVEIISGEARAMVEAGQKKTVLPVEAEYVIREPAA